MREETENIHLPEEFSSIKSSAHAVYKEKGSEFIADAFPLYPDADPGEHLGAIKKQYYDASHHCYAYLRISGEAKSSDDGEPAGSAGMRITGAIEHFGFREILVVVTRYFGGTKLGIGPLGKAYHEAARLVLENAAPVAYHQYHATELQYPHDLTSIIYRLINRHRVKIREEQYSDSVTMKLWIPAGETDAFIAAVENDSAGKAAAESQSSFIYLPE